MLLARKMKKLSKEDYNAIVHKPHVYRPKRIGRFSQIIKLVCLTCKTEFEVTSSIANNGRKYCKKECVPRTYARRLNYSKF